MFFFSLQKFSLYLPQTRKNSILSRGIVKESIFELYKLLIWRAHFTEPVVVSGVPRKGKTGNDNISSCVLPPLHRHRPLWPSWPPWPSRPSRVLILCSFLFYIFKTWYFCFKSSDIWEKKCFILSLLSTLYGTLARVNAIVAIGSVWNNKSYLA